MVKRKKLYLISLFTLIGVILSLFCFIFFIIIGISKSFIFLLSIVILFFYTFLIGFFYLQKIFSNIKSKLKILDVKEKAVKDIYRYEQFLNPPNIDN